MKLPQCEERAPTGGAVPVLCELLAGHAGEWHIAGECMWRKKVTGERSRACPHCGRDVW